MNKEDLEDAIISANEDDSVDGIIVYFPVFGGGQAESLLFFSEDEVPNPMAGSISSTNHICDEGC